MSESSQFSPEPIPGAEYYRFVGHGADRKLVTLSGREVKDLKRNGQTYSEIMAAPRAGYAGIAAYVRDGDIQYWAYPAVTTPVDDPTKAREERLREQFFEIPDAMKLARRWLLWRLWNERKVPYYVDGTPRRDALDSPQDMARFGSFNDAVVQLSTGRFAGLAFALGPDGTGNFWQGIDLDDLPKRPELEHVADALPGYTERSPSGEGMHAIGYGRPFKTLGANRTGVEAYSSARFFTVTGDGAGRHEPCDLSDFVAEQLEPLHSRGKQAPEGPPAADPVLDAKSVTELRDALNAIPSDDRDVWIKMGMALRTLGDVGRGLWLTWSQTSPKFDAADAGKTWDSLKPTDTSYRAVFAEAQRRGWVNPLSNSAMVAPVSGQVSDPHDTAQSEWSSALFVTAEDLVKEPTPTTYLIDELVEHPSLALLFGAPSAGKSFVALAWSASIAAGVPWARRDCRQGAVFYLAGEGHAGLSRRLMAWSIDASHSLAGVPLFVSKMPAALMDPQSADAVEREVATLCAQHGPPALIVVDTLARNMGAGDENSNADIGVFVSRIDRIRHTLGCTVLIVHHTGYLDPKRARGASALPAAMDVAFHLENHEPLRKLIQTKSKESEIGEPLNLAIKSVPIGWLDIKGREMVSAVIELAEGIEVAASEEKLTAVQSMAFQTLCETAIADGNEEDGRMSVHMELWRPRFFALLEGKTPEAKRKAFGRARDDLEKLGRIRVVGSICGVSCDEPALIAASFLARVTDRTT